MPHTKHHEGGAVSNAVVAELAHAKLSNIYFLECSVTYRSPILGRRAGGAELNIVMRSPFKPIPVNAEVTRRYGWH